eukprot:TRINITY_DN58302_c0_g2_i5.p1 TRINITY_DN58302_c0_g2~~TRINITY_DN58302_c0_g2_i5.p1  ORF type:complete len:353 (+),score=33.03 TRINITY_DN58302_c0_g2_i5:481-1539(+)
MGHDRGAFPVPLMMSSFQFVLQHLLSKAVLNAGLIERTSDTSLSWKEWAQTSLPNGISTGLDIGFSNKSYMFITVTFYTMCKSTTPMFLLMFAFLWGIEKPTWQILKVVLLICLGLFLFVFGESEFNLFGFILVMTAAALAGFRWMMTQVQLQGNSQKDGGRISQGGPLEVMERLTPIMSLTLLLTSLLGERALWHLTSYSYFASFQQVLGTICLLTFGSVVAWVMVWTEFKVIQQASSLTLVIAGTFKELFTVLAGVLLDGDSFTWINGVGLIILIMGVSLYNYQKYQKMKQGEIRIHRRFDEGEDGQLEMQPLTNFEDNSSSPKANNNVRHTATKQLQEASVGNNQSSQA